MGLIQTIKNLFKKGGYVVTGQSLNRITDHPKVNISEEELSRIERNFRQYEGKYPDVEYLSSNGKKTHRPYMTMNMRKLTAEMMTSLVFNEQTEISIDDDTANEFINRIFEHNDFKKNLSRYLEPMFATGGLVVRPYFDHGTGEIEFSWGLANSFIPLQSNTNGISEGVMMFKSSQATGNITKYFTLLEFHEWINGQYTISNELYVSDNPGMIGNRTPLGVLYGDLKETATLTKMASTLFSYLKPAGFNNISPYSPLGLGICDNCENTLRQINDTFDQFNWEIRMGQRTIAVSDHMLNYRLDEQGKGMEANFDPDVNIYKSLPTNQDTEFVKDLTRDIRTEQYTSAINQFLKTLEMQMQLSVGTFSFDGRSVKTATEVASENSLTYRTRNMQCNEVEKFIKSVIISTLELAKRTISKEGKLVYSGAIPTMDQISVDFDDGIFESQDAKLEFYQKATTAQLVPKVEAIKSIFKLTDKEAAKWLSIIQMEAELTDPVEIQKRWEEDELGGEE
nr:MAG TPA: portal protein [Caudoviricetes sp.]